MNSNNDVKFIKNYFCFRDRGLHLAHQAVHHVDVVLGQELHAEQLFRLDQVMHVGAREVAAAIAVAGLVDRRGIVLEARVLEVDALALHARHQSGAMARDAGRADAIEGVDALRDAGEDVADAADAEQVRRPLAVQRFHRVADHLVHLGAVRAERAADGVAEKRAVVHDRPPLRGAGPDTRRPAGCRRAPACRHGRARTRRCSGRPSGC